MNLRDSILQATDPEKALLIDIPLGIGFKPLIEQSDSEFSKFIIQLEECLIDISTAFPRLVLGYKTQLMEKLGANEVGLATEKEFLRNIIESINSQNLGNQIKVILKRMTSPLDNEVFFWKAIIDSIAEFNLESIQDEQIEIVQQKITISSEAILTLVGMKETGTANIGLTITTSDGSTKRKFSSPLSETEVVKSHKILLNYLEKLDSRTRFNLLTHLIHKELS
jgi:hypothetical protein